MKLIRVLSFPVRIDKNSRSYSDPKPDIYAARLGLAPIKPAEQPAPHEPADTLSSGAASAP
jgi:hypothetical protein